MATTTTQPEQSETQYSSDGLPYLVPNLKPLPPDVWKPTKHLTRPEPPPLPPDLGPVAEQAVLMAGIDGKALLKKMKPRRTVDYFSPMGRWLLMKKVEPSPGFVPHLRPAPPYVIDLLPPAAYPDNTSTSLCTKFVHTSTNKVRGPVNVVTWTPTGRRVLTGSTSGEFTLWNGLTFNFETILQAHDYAIRAFEFNHSGNYLASADQGGMVKYYLENMNCVFSYQAHPQAVRGLSFSPNDSRFVTGSDDATLKIWAFEESREERTLTGHGWDVRCVQWHPSKGLLASGSKDNLIKFWDPRTGTCLSTLHQHKNTIQALAFSPYLDGNYLAAGSRDQSMSVFDIRAMKELRIYRGHKKEVCSITWHPFHPLIVSGGSEGDLLYWDLYSPADASSSAGIGLTPISEPRATLSQAHEGNVWSLSFHPLGHLLASASNDHTTRFWSRERPGDATSVFSGGGEKPPDVGEGEGEEDDMWGENALPGLGGYDSLPGLEDGYDAPYDQAMAVSSSSGSGIPGMGGNNALSNAMQTSVKDVDIYDDVDALPGLGGGSSYPAGGNVYNGGGLSAAGGAGYARNSREPLPSQASLLPREGDGQRKKTRWGT